MNALYNFYFYSLLKNFNPATPMFTPFLSQTKKIKNSDVHGTLVTYFFIASLIFAIISPEILNLFGKKTGLVFGTLCDFILNFIFLTMPEGSIFFGSLGCFLHGIGTSIVHISTTIVYELTSSSEEKKMAMSRFHLIKKIGSLTSVWFAQDLFFSTSNHISSMYISTVLLFISCISATFLPGKPTSQKKHLLIFSFLKDGFFPTIKEIYKKELIFFYLNSLLASILSLSFIVYSYSIFAERKKNTDASTGIVALFYYKISAPFRWLAFLCVKIISIFDKSIVYNPKYDKNVVIFGYIDGTAKIISNTLIYFLVIVDYSENVLKALSIASVLLVIFSMVLLGNVNSLFSTYLCYILGSTSSATLSQLSQLRIRESPRLSEIIGFNMFIGSFIHVTISTFCRYKKYSAGQKMRYYLAISLIFFGTSIISLFL